MGRKFLVNPERVGDVADRPGASRLISPVHGFKFLSEARRSIEVRIISRKSAHEFWVGHFLSKEGLALRLHESVERAFNVDEPFEPGPEFDK
jgi:hypothetical protein